MNCKIMTTFSFKLFTRALFIVFLNLVLVLSSEAKTYEEGEGKDYEVRSETASDSPRIREFFSFWCGHCFMMQEPFSKLAEHVKDKAEFRMNPVSSLGGEAGVESQKAFAAAKVLGVDKEFAATLFDEMHKQEKIPQDHNDFVRIFESIGIPKSVYEKESSSFVVLGMVSEFDSATEKLKIDAVPEIVVNDKYYVNMEKLETIGELIQIVDYLLTLK